MEEVRNQITSSEIQEKDRRLALEIPDYNWLENKIIKGTLPNRQSKPNSNSKSSTTNPKTSGNKVQSDAATSENRY